MKQTAIRLNVDVGPDHTIKLPDEVPEGPAEVIVLVQDGRTSKEARLVCSRMSLKSSTK